jgi:hypothetical protein
MANKRQKRAAASLHILQPNAAGADIGAEEIFVAVPPDRDDEPVRPNTYGTCRKLWTK